MTTPQITDVVWQMMGQRLGYNDEELELFKRNPRNAKVLAVGQEMLTKTFVFEVTESTGCHSEHHVGTRFFFSGDGNLLTSMAPSKVCAFLLPNMTLAINAMQELWYAGVDPNERCFNLGGCPDVGVKCGGWGHVKVESKLVDRAEAIELYEQSK